MTIENPLVLKLRFLQELTHEQADLIGDLASITYEIGAGEDIVKRGARSFYGVVSAGWAGRFEFWNNGLRSITALYLPGDYFDLEAYLFPQQKQTIMAITDCKIDLITHAALDNIANQSPQLSRLLWRSTSLEASILSQWLSVARGLPAMERLAHLLCELYLRLGAIHRTEDDSFAFPLRQSELADVLALSLVHVSRSVNALRATGAIAWEQRRITILDWDKLVSICDFNPSYLKFPVNRATWDKLEPPLRSPVGRHWVDALLRTERILGLLDETAVAIEKSRELVRESLELLDRT